MHARTLRIALIGYLALAATVAALAIAPAESSAVTPRSMRVKLYESGKQIGEWTTDGPVRNEGNVLVFNTRQGVSSREVRIHGTYSAETVE